jgi:hypothetical protein
MSATSARDWQQAQQGRSDRVPMWVTGVTVALLALGFSRPRASSPAGTIPTGDEREGRVIAAQRGRGRSATTPSEVPPRGWKDILLRIWKNIGKDRVIVVAAGVTFYAVLAPPQSLPLWRCMAYSPIPPPSRLTSTVLPG